MNDLEAILRMVTDVLVVDWPSTDVPEELVRAGYRVAVKGGPEPDDYTAYELRDGRIETRALGRRPERADLIYAFRPVDELPQIVTLARELGATAVWLQSGLAADGTRDPTGCWMPPERSTEARRIVESAGLVYLERPYIVEALRRGGPREAPA